MISTIIILSLMIWGVAALFTEGMLLEKAGAAIEQSKYRWFFKPLVLCPPCMSSVWGTAASLYLGCDVAHWFTLVFATAGLNYLIANK